jgi:hypothetical protein
VENHEFKASLSYIARPVSKNRQKEREKKCFSCWIQSSSKFQIFEDSINLSDKHLLNAYSVPGTELGRNSVLGSLTPSSKQYTGVVP